MNVSVDFFAFANCVFPTRFDGNEQIFTEAVAEALNCQLAELAGPIKIQTSQAVF